MKKIIAILILCVFVFSCNNNVSKEKLKTQKERNTLFIEEHILKMKKLIEEWETERTNYVFCIEKRLTIPNLIRGSIKIKKGDLINFKYPTYSFYLKEGIRHSKQDLNKLNIKDIFSPIDYRFSIFGFLNNKVVCYAAIKKFDNPHIFSNKIKKKYLEKGNSLNFQEGVNNDKFVIQEELSMYKEKLLLTNGKQFFCTENNKFCFLYNGKLKLIEKDKFGKFIVVDDLNKLKY